MLARIFILKCYEFLRSNLKLLVFLLFILGTFLENYDFIYIDFFILYIFDKPVLVMDIDGKNMQAILL
jgi:hypothetical protein